MRTIVKRVCKTTIFIIIILILIFISTIQLGFADTGLEEKGKNILLLNSYHIGFKWTDDITASFLSAVRSEAYEITINLEHINWKRYPTQANLDLLYESLKYKYQNEKIDLIAVTDDIAFQFALTHRNEIFSSAPIVFAGVNEKSLENLRIGHKGFTGVLESVDMDRMIETWFIAQPELERVYLLYDFTESGLSTGLSAYNAIKKLKPEIEIYSLNNMSHEQLLVEASKIEGNAIIVYLAYSTDVDGIVVEPEAFTKLLSEKVSVPIVSTYDVVLGYGILGGSMVSAKLYGELLGDIALELIRGIEIEDIPIIYEPVLRTAYDYEQLKRFNISLDMLNENAEIVNKPFSFFETYRVYVLATSGVITLLSVLLVIISIIAQRLKKAQAGLLESHQELIQLHEELVASEEELRSQFDELVLVKKYLQVSEERYRLAVDATNDAIVDWDLQNDTYKFTERWMDLTGYSKAEIEQKNAWKKIIHEEDHWKFWRVFNRDFNNISERDQFQYRLKTKTGDWKWILLRRTVLFDDKGEAVRMVSAHTDIDQIKKAQDELEFVAYHDSLTGQRNKRDLIRILDIITSSAEKRSFSLIFMDIDNFKLINNSMGHSFGDLLLKDIGERIAKNVSDNAEVFALSGANFVVLLNMKDAAETDKTIEALTNCFKDSFESNGISVNLSFSVGVTTFPQHGKTTDELLRNTDIALHEAKRRGKGQCVYFGQMMKIQLMERMIMERCLRDALADNQFSLHYQPQLCLKSGKITMLEALLRWKNPQLGNVSPNQFIKVAEENRQIIPIGEWVIDEACALLSRLHRNGYADIGISINISLIQLMQENFVEYVGRTLAKYDLSHEYIEFEITESMFMESLELINERLLDLIEGGLKIALDDFGKGYSSLSYLKHMPVIKIKIDKSFIDGITKGDKEKNIVDFIVMIGQRMGKEIVAEGVETIDQFDFMMQHGCDNVQGYLLAKPMPEDKVIEYLEHMRNKTLDQIVSELRKTD